MFYNKYLDWDCVNEWGLGNSGNLGNFGKISCVCNTKLVTSCINAGIRKRLI